MMIEFIVQMLLKSKLDTLQAGCRWGLSPQGFLPVGCRDRPDLCMGYWKGSECRMMILQYFRNPAGTNARQG